MTRLLILASLAVACAAAAISFQARAEEKVLRTFEPTASPQSVVDSIQFCVKHLTAGGIPLSHFSQDGWESYKWRSQYAPPSQEAKAHMHVKGGMRLLVNIPTDDEPAECVAPAQLAAGSGAKAHEMFVAAFPRAQRLDKFDDWKSEYRLASKITIVISDEHTEPKHDGSDSGIVTITASYNSNPEHQP